jgi:hypothetical protein
MFMGHHRTISALMLALFSWTFPAGGADELRVSTVDELVNAVNSGSPGDRIYVAAGTFILTAPLAPKESMTVRGAGTGRTIIAGAESWKPETTDLPKTDDPTAYLFRLKKTGGVKISDMTLTGPNLHGAIYGDGAEGLELFNLRVEKFVWSGIRTYRMKCLRVHDCVFVDAGGKFGSTTGGALYMHWSADSDFWNNRISKTERAANFFGFKGYGGRNCRFHHNTVEVNFSLEFPHDNNLHMEVDHNAFSGTISIPKHSGGAAPPEGHTFRIHHNWLKKSYALEWPRNAVEVDHNLFDFSTADDGGNLISRFGNDSAPGPTLFHDNLIRNPGRGVFWSNGIYNQFSFYNNHVIANTTATPRRDGLFGLNAANDFNTVTIRDNIIQCTGTSRPLMRNAASYKARIENNTLINVSDRESYSNKDTGAQRGPIELLKFDCGADGEFLVEGWNVTPRTAPAGAENVQPQSGQP